MFRMAPLLFLLVSFACKRAPDPLAEQRKTCQELSASKSLKAGLSVEDCARELKVRAGADGAPADAGSATAQK
jgi:hypothetical protein